MASWNLNPSKIHQQKEGTFYIRASYEDPLPRVSEGKPRLQELRKQNMKAGFQLRTIHFIHSRMRTPNMVDFDVPHLICSWNVPNSWNWTPQFSFPVLWKVFNHQNDPSLNLDFHVNLNQHVKQRIINFFSTPHFFPTCLKHNSRKLEKKTSKNRRNPRQSYLDVDTLRLGMDLDLLDPALLQVSKVTSNSIVDP